MLQIDCRAQMEHLRFPGLFQWEHLRQAFQGLFQLWEGLVVLKRTVSFGFCWFGSLWGWCFGRRSLFSLLPLMLDVLGPLVMHNFLSCLGPLGC